MNPPPLCRAHLSSPSGRRSADIPDDHVVLGQYGAHPEGKEPAYWEDESIRDRDTCTPTYCAAVLFVDNDRWRGVPFIMKAGKALNERKTEVRMQLRPSPHAAMFASTASQNNELVIKIQPGARGGWEGDCGERTVGAAPPADAGRAPVQESPCTPSASPRRPA